MLHPKLDRFISRWRLRGRFFRLLLNRRWAANLTEITLNGYLGQTGWLRSMQQLEVQDAAGRPTPWYSIPCVDFLAPRIRRDWRIFEYGSGASTRYFAERVEAVWAVEHNAAFAAELQPRLAGHVRLLVRPEYSAAYVQSVREMPDPVDLISVDGRDRVACMAEAVQRLAPSGVLILDDAERPEYAAGIAQMRQAGFRALEFWGISVGTIDRKCTTIFYRGDNILGI